jgi:hypothetical protein
MTSSSSRLRLFIGITARLALVVVTAQIAALDHHFGITDVVGVEGSSAHAVHCHGDAGGCAGSASGAVVAMEDAFRLPRQLVRPLALDTAAIKPAAAVTTVESEPPRL